MLTKKVAIYVPSIIQGIKASKLQAYWVNKCQLRLVQLFGGFTSYHATGGWKSTENQLVEEQVTVVESFTDENKLHSQEDQVRNLARDIAISMKQESVAIDVGGMFDFVTA